MRRAAGGNSAVMKCWKSNKNRVKKYFEKNFILSIDNTDLVCYHNSVARETQATADRQTVTRSPDSGKGVTLMDYIVLILFAVLLIIVAIKK